MCEYIITEDFLWTSIFMMKATVFGMNCKEIIIFLVFQFSQGAVAAGHKSEKYCF